VQPLHQQPHEALVSDSVFDEAFHPLVIDRVEKRADIRIDHPAHPPVDGHRECIQGHVLRPASPEAIRKTRNSSS